MNLSLLYSAILHCAAFFLMFALMQGAPSKKNKATYTIDFIGTASQPLRYGEPEKTTPPPAPAKEEVKAPTKQEPVKSEIKEVKKEQPKKTVKKEYNSKEQIAQTPKTEEPKKQQAETKPEPEKKVELSKPSILDEIESTNIDPSAIHNLSTSTEGDGGPKTIRASFTNFPYPWYITQVRNSLWTQWQKRMPKKGAGLSALVSFNIDKYGAVYGIQIERSSGNDSYDYAATSAAENSAPFPPLPKDFPKNLLTVTVEFKNEE